MNETAETAKILTVRRVSRWMTCSAAALLLVTWKLWTPQTVFPQIPFFEFLIRVPGWVDWILLTGVAVPLVMGYFTQPPFRVGRMVMSAFAVCLTGLVLLDQHRLQPWAWQFLLIAFVLITLPNANGLRWCRLLTLSIYFWSAISKFDHSFLHGHANLFLGVIADWSGTKLADWPETLRLTTALMFPVGELLVAILLLFWPHRRIGLWASWLMHGLLIAIVGPLGLQHEWGVLFWNLYFIRQNLLLFPTTPEDRWIPTLPKERKTLAIGVSVVMGVIIVLPISATGGWFDEWPSWAVYTGRAEQIYVEVREDVRNSVPENIPIARESSDDDLGFQAWQTINLGKWSLQTLETPIYPQARFRLAVANAVAENLSDKSGIRVTVQSEADRMTGQRWTETYQGQEELELLLSRFWLNTKPRQIWSPTP